MATIFDAYAQPVRSVADYMGDADMRDLRRAQLQGATQNNAMQALTMGQSRQTMADTQRKQNALREAAQAAGPNADPVQFANNLMRNPDTMDAGVALQKHLADTGKVQADTDKSRADAGKTVGETAETKKKSLFQTAAALGSRQEAFDFINAGVKDGLPTTVATAMGRMVQSDPDWQRKLTLVVASPDKFSELLQPHMVAAGGALVNTNPLAGPTGQGAPSAIPITQSSDNAATNARSAADSAATRAQAERHFTTTRADGKWTYDSERGGQVNTQTGEFRPAVQGGVPIGPKDKQPSEGERVAAGFATRMVEATPLLDKFEKSGRPGYTQAFAGGIPLIGGAARTATMNAEQQQYRQAQEDWVRAKLRKESGAAIGVDEMDKEIATYFPQPGEKSAVIAQKQRARAIATEAMNKAAGRAAYNSAVPPQAPSEPPPKTASGATASNW